MNTRCGSLAGAPAALVLGALPILCVAQAPQFTAIDLGPITYPGDGLNWGRPPQVIRNDYASLGGTPTFNSIQENADGPFEAVGYSDVPGTPFAWHAALWTDPQHVVDLGVLPGAQNGQDSGPTSIAYAFNSVGDVVGESSAPSSPYHAFLWNSGVMHDLGVLGTQGRGSIAYAVNNLHEVVGWAQTVSDVTGDTLDRAFLYTGGTMYNLTFLLDVQNIRLTQATGIDCQGNIAATGTFTTATGGLRPGVPHSFLVIRKGASRNCPDPGM